MNWTCFFKGKIGLVYSFWFDYRTASVENSKFKRLKIISYNNFTVLDFNPAGNIIMTAIQGNYELAPSKGIGSYDDLVQDSSVISERVNSVSRESAGILGDNPYYGVKLDSAGLLHYNGMYKTKGSEIWMRVIESRIEMLYALISKNPKDQKFKIDPRMIIILSDGRTQTVEVKADEKLPQPLNIIKSIDVESVEFVGNAEAIEQFGMRGHHGVCNLSVSKENFEKVTKILRMQKKI
jgi:hypothetical protein